MFVAGESVVTSVSLDICRGVANLVLAVATTLWCGWTAAKLFSKMAPSISDQSMLVAYPCTLMYSAFALLTVY